MAKRILRDPNLSKLATAKFHKLVDKDDDCKFMKTDIKKAGDAQKQAKKDGTATPGSGGG